MINQFEDILNLIPDDRVYIQNESLELTYGGVKSLISQFSQKYSYLVGKHCALVTNSRYELAKNLPLIASVASKIYLQPRCLKAGVLQQFYQNSDIEYIITISDSGIETKEL